MAPNGGTPSVRAAPVRSSQANGLAHERVGEIQRSRILVSMAEVACERGAGDVSVVHVVERAGVSRRTFYEIFEGGEDCFLAVFEEALARAGDYVSTVYDQTVVWVERVRSGLEALLRFLEAEPAFGRVAVVESAVAGVKVLELRRGVIVRLVAVVDEGRQESPVDSPSVGQLTAEGVVGGVLSVIHGRLIVSNPEGLEKLVNPLMSMIVLPYLGAAAARREMERPATKISVRAPGATGNPLKGLDMRLTYRTVRVLSAIAANRGASNRAIGDAAGVSDQGQISKLLARLEKLGLAENACSGSSRGAPNAWMLTKQGEEVADVIATDQVPA
jgi:AcrR family transcriptional regulator/DNA-binding MarR family transcriptional regulator